MKKLKAQLTPLGSAGSASGTAAFNQVVDGGTLYAVYLDYAGSAPATTDVTIKLADPAVNVLQVSNNAIDGWFFPRYRTSYRTPTAAALYTVAADDVGLALPIVGELNLVVLQSNPISNGVTAYVYVQED